MTQSGFWWPSLIHNTEGEVLPHEVGLQNLDLCRTCRSLSGRGSDVHSSSDSHDQHLSCCLHGAIKTPPTLTSIPGERAIWAEFSAALASPTELSTTVPVSKDGNGPGLNPGL